MSSARNLIGCRRLVHCGALIDAFMPPHAGVSTPAPTVRRRAAPWSTSMLRDSDYERCAEAMVRTFGLRAARRRAELRALQLQLEENGDCAEIWTRVAAALRRHTEAQAA